MRLNKEDILHALGFETRQESMTDMFLMFGVGLAAGAVIGMLLAPKAGFELRHDVKEKAEDLVSNVKAKIMRNHNEYQNQGYTPNLPTGGNPSGGV